MMAAVRLGPQILFALEMKGQVLHRTPVHLNVAGLMIGFQCGFNKEIA